MPKDRFWIGCRKFLHAWAHTCHFFRWKKHHNKHIFKSFLHKQPGTTVQAAWYVERLMLYMHAVQRKVSKRLCGNTKVVSFWSCSKLQVRSEAKFLTSININFLIKIFVIFKKSLQANKLYSMWLKLANKIKKSPRNLKIQNFFWTYFWSLFPQMRWENCVFFVFHSKTNKTLVKRNATVPTVKATCKHNVGWMIRTISSYIWL